MAAVRGLRVSVKAEASAGLALGLPSPEAEPGLERGEPEPMEVEEGELEMVPVRRSLKELIPGVSEDGLGCLGGNRTESGPDGAVSGAGTLGSLRVLLRGGWWLDTSRRYENKAGSFITGIDVTSKEAIEKKEQRAKRFHLRSEVNLAQRNIALDRDLMKKAIPKVRLETIYICGVDEMSTQDIFSYFKEYPPAHIEWLDDTSYKQEDSSDDEAEEGEVEDENSSDVELETLSQVEEESLLRNDLRPANKLAKGNKLFMRFATKDDKKELGAARRSQYYMKYGNPNYGGMKGILSNSWKRRYHSRRIQRDVIKKRAMIGDDVGLTSYKHRHSGLVNVPEEPIEEEEEEEEEEDQDMDADDRVVVEYHEELPALKQTRERSSSRRSSASSSDSDEMDYDLELKMISTPSPKKSMKMTMYADEVESQLKNIRNSMRSDTISTSNIKHRIGNKLPTEKFADVRHLLDEKRQHTRPRPSGSSTKS
ncbi:hypothetical protein QTO34_009467, partial [Cnephaeus nilssonii]